jgi:hypothetical protein
MAASISKSGERSQRICGIASENRCHFQILQEKYLNILGFAQFSPTQSTAYAALLSPMRFKLLHLQNAP